MKLRTEIEHKSLRRLIDRREGVLLLGSCFTDHIGQWLEESWLPVKSNPYGVLFNPSSIAGTLQRLLKDELFLPELHEQAGRYYSFDHHGKWSGDDPQTLAGRLVELEEDCRTFLRSAGHLFVTFGTSWVYEREGRVVANCHKFPASDFIRRRLSVDEIVNQWSEIIPLLPHITFTVSPIRHIKDTLHGNQLSKGTLLLAIEELQQRYPDKVDYLPVYELFMDDLRDYRFYADDLVHPSSLAVEAVKEFFLECAMTPQLRQYMLQAAPIVRALQHRPTDADSLQYQEFLAETLRKKELLIKSL